MDLSTRTIDRLAVDGPDWLADLRRRGYALHHELPPPDRAQHRWRYVDPERLMPGERALAPFGAPGAFSVGADLADDDPAAVRIERGASGVVARFSAEARHARVTVLDLDAAARAHEGVLREWFGKLVTPDDSRFAALNAAFWTGGLFVAVPKGARLTRPIHVRTEAPAAGLALPRTFVAAGETADVTVLDELTGPPDVAADARTDALLHGALEVVVGPGAHVEIVAIQDLPLKATAATVTHVRLDRESSVKQLFAAFGGGIAKADIVVDACGRGATADVLGAVFGGGRQQFDAHTLLRHAAPDTTTHLDVRVALSGKAKSSSTGRLWIGKEAVRSQAYQENRNLLLSETSSAVSIPELEILTDEVQAKHGATVGPIDEDQLYYLLSRGLPHDEATAMIVGGFFQALLDRLPGGLLQERIQGRIETRLTGR